MLPTAFLSLSLLNLLALGVDSSTSKAPSASGKPQKAQQTSSSLGHPSWSLGLQFYQALRHEGSHTNTLISPVLLASSLGALSRAAKGSTAGQLQELLRSAKEEKKAEEALSDALKSLREGNGTSYALHGSLALFSKQVPALEKSFLEELQAQFGLRHVALSAGDKHSDIEKLSSWAKGEMGGLDRSPLTEGPDAKEGALILANALHFKGFWDRGFNQENQDLRSFLGTKYTKVHMMHRVGVYRHYEDMENMVQVLELGLWGGKASMMLLLPFHVESLARLERVLTLEQLEKWLGKLSSMSMAVSLPRVNVSSALSLQACFTRLEQQEKQQSCSKPHLIQPGENSRSRAVLMGVFQTHVVQYGSSVWSVSRNSWCAPMGARCRSNALGQNYEGEQSLLRLPGIVVLISKGNQQLHLGGIRSSHWARSLEATSSSVSGSVDSTDEDEHVEKPKLFYADHSFIILVKDNSTGALLLLGALDLAEGVALHDEL
ncbi:hypothetical protein NFI96_012387 [Prochilodus magdalenae]|nr:hypothetical protein NFI96_012387 [Prochilodus magdalenae]